MTSWLQVGHVHVGHVGHFCCSVSTVGWSDEDTTGFSNEIESQSDLVKFKINVKKHICTWNHYVYTPCIVG